MKIILMILLSTCLSIGNAEYPRYKRKGLPQNIPQRLPTASQFAKKWGKPSQNLPPQFMQGRPYQGPRMPPRGNRPSKPQMGTNLNMHMTQMQHSMYNKPKFHQFQQFLQPQKNYAGPIKDFFKKPNQLHQQQNIQNHPAISGQIIQFPAEIRNVPKTIQKQEKPLFVSSPSIPTGFEYDYQVQTNNIPMNINTIKQIGEKGPIHTIPAPNLSPADKPSHVELRRPQNYHQEQQIRYQEPQFINEETQAHHQYQVTEQNEQSSKRLFKDNINVQAHYNPVQMGHLQNQQADLQGNVQGFQNVQPVFYGSESLGVTVQENGNRGINIGFSQEQTNQPGEDMVFSNSEHYQVVNGQISNEQHMHNLHTQAIQSSYEQQHPEKMGKFVQSQESQYGPRYREGNAQAAEENNLNIEPEYHSFNYDEQAHQAQAKSGTSSGFVTATYSLGQEKTEKEQNINSRSSSVDPLTQSQIVQSYFDTRANNDVEPDAKPSGSGNAVKERLNSSLYSSLPSKDAADRLAKLQAAGKVNSNLMQIGSTKTSQNAKDDIRDEKEETDSREQSVDYDDYSQEDDESQSDKETGFGRKTKF